MVPRLYEFLRFCIVGFVGFIADAGGLEAFATLGFITPIARLFSIAIALQITYLLHSFFTFHSHAGISAKGWLHFMALNLIGAAINYGVFFLVWRSAFLDDPRLLRQLALLCGIAVALLFNYWSNSKFVFAKKHTNDA